MQKFSFRACQCIHQKTARQKGDDGQNEIAQCNVKVYRLRKERLNISRNRCKRNEIGRFYNKLIKGQTAPVQNLIAKAEKYECNQINKKSRQKIFVGLFDSV